MNIISFSLIEPREEDGIIPIFKQMRKVRLPVLKRSDAGLKRRSSTLSPLNLCDSKQGVHPAVKSETVLSKPYTAILQNYQGHGNTRKD